jgi:hypothetical protein
MVGPRIKPGTPAPVASNFDHKTTEALNRREAFLNLFFRLTDNTIENKEKKKNNNETT